MALGSQDFLNGVVEMIILKLILEEQGLNPCTETNTCRFRIGTSGVILSQLGTFRLRGLKLELRF
jgi:hypothetical protein